MKRMIATAFFAVALTGTARADPAEDAARARNRATVERFFALPIGEERLALYAEDAVKELVASDWRWVGRAALAANTEGNAKMFPEWHWFDVRIDATTNPNRFWVEADGSGRHVIAPGSQPVPYGAHYVLQIDLRDGKIVRMREFRVPVERECKTLSPSC